MKLAVFALTNNGIKLAHKLSDKLHEAELFCVPEKLKANIKYAFNNYDGLIFIMAAGIVVRMIAPLLKSKVHDPAVVVMDEKGKYAVSLLSGHMGGANKLAIRISRSVGAKPVITTATDVNNLPCIEDIAEKFHLKIEDAGRIKIINSAILNNKSIAFVDEDAKRLEAIKEFMEAKAKKIKFYKSTTQAKHTKPAVIVFISNSLTFNLQPSAFSLLLRPKNIVVGVGCDRGVSEKEVEAAYSGVLKKWDISPLSVRNLASIDVKSDETGLLKFAKKCNLKIVFFSKDELADMPLPSGFSKFVMGKVGVGGVCEPAALKSAGTKKIWIKKQKLGRVTIAAAKAPFAL